ncbi:MAG: hypothetical protein V7700_03845 [Halioglobus sp.]
MFTNKHVIIAVIVAPILSILAWFAVGNFIGEEPTVAQPGQSYPLVEKSNCRYPSGVCDLANEDFKLGLSYDDAVSGPQLVVRASHPLEGVVLSLGVAEPTAMRATDGQVLEWRIAIAEKPTPDLRIRVVARVAGSSYYGEAGTLFLLPKDRQWER